MLNSSNRSIMTINSILRPKKNEISKKLNFLDKNTHSFTRGVNYVLYSLSPNIALGYCEVLNHTNLIHYHFFQENRNIIPLKWLLIIFVNFCPNVTKIFLVNILVIWDDPCDFCGSLCVFGRKKVGSKQKSSENSRFFVFFLKNDQILTNTKTFKIRFYFIETQKQVHNILLNTF
jgi:hypothetical protein